MLYFYSSGILYIRKHYITTANKFFFLKVVGFPSFIGGEN